VGGSSIERVGHGTALWADLGLKGMQHAAARILVIVLSLQIGPKIMNLHEVLSERLSGTRARGADLCGRVRYAVGSLRRSSRSLIR
jgi:hypothetical protein